MSWHLDTRLLAEILTRVIYRRFFQALSERICRRPWVVGWIAVLFLVLAVDSGKILREGQASFRSRSDFEDYFEAAKRLRSGEDLYLQDQMDRVFQEAARLPSLTPAEVAALIAQLKGVGAYLYPPFFAWMLGPLTGLDYRAAAVVYQGLSLLALAAFFFIAYVVLRSARGDSGVASGVGVLPDCVAGGVVLAALLYAGFLDENAANGNAGNLLILLSGVGLLLSFRSAKEDGLSLAGGFLIGLAAAIKIMPGFLAGVLVAGRRGRALAGFSLGLGCAVFAPALTLGWERDLALHQDWYTFLIQTYSKFSVVRPYANNQTISAALSKLFIGGSDLKQAAYGLPLGLFEGNPLMVAAMIRLANLALTGVLGVIVLLVAWRRPVGDLRDPSLSRLVSLTLLTALVTSGVSWYHTYALMVIPLSMRLGLERPLDLGDRLGMLAPALAGLFLLVLPRPVVEALSLYSFFTWIVLLAVLSQQRQMIARFTDSGHTGGSR